MRTPRNENDNPTNAPTNLLSRSFDELATLEALEPIGELAASILRDNGGELGPVGSKARAAMIEAVRAGKHIELRVRALTFRQKDGHPNKNYIRIKSSILGTVGASYVGRPFLLDHATYATRARMGTIEESEAVPLAGGWTGFRQTLRVVKPDAVIGVLDGTLDRFSIGWDPRGAILCTAHKVDVRSRAACWRLEGCYPGKRVEVDGATLIAEYEWQSTEGVEVSAVNNPAVSGTKIENIAATLAAELGLDTTTIDPEPARKDPKMARLPLLLAALSLPNTGGAAELSDADDGRLAERITELRGELKATIEERDTALAANKEHTAKIAELEGKLAKLEAGEVDTILEVEGYKAGKLIRGKDAEGKPTASSREVRLRRIAKEDGVAALRAELGEMPVVAPLGRAVLDERDPNPRALGGGPIPSTVLASTAAQLGLKPEELEEHANTLRGRDGGGDN